MRAPPAKLLMKKYPKSGATLTVVTLSLSSLPYLVKLREAEPPASHWPLLICENDVVANVRKHAAKINFFIVSFLWVK